MEKDLEAAREKISMRDREFASVQGTLRGLEDERRKMGSAVDRTGLERDIERLHQELDRLDEELNVAREELENKEDALRQRELEIAAMVRSSLSRPRHSDVQLDKQRDLEARLSSERQGRLNMSDRLDHANKVSYVMTQQQRDN